MIDWGQVELLRSEIGDDAFSEVVDLFLEEIGSDIGALTQESGAARLEARFHALKGSALNLGFVEFAELCGSAESAAAKGTVETCDGATLEAAFDASKVAFLNGLNSQKVTIK